MSLLSKLFNFVPKNEREGIALGQNPQWEVSEAKDFPSFLRALIHLIPEGSVLYLEGGTPRSELLQFLEKKLVPEQSHLAMGTIWPRPLVHHVLATSQNLAELADIAENYCSPEVAIHTHVYRGNRVLLQWYDAFADPLYISKDIPEDDVKKFCEVLSIEYKSVN